MNDGWIIVLLAVVCYPAIFIIPPAMLIERILRWLRSQKS